MAPRRTSGSGTTGDTPARTSRAPRSAAPARAARPVRPPVRDFTGTATPTFAIEWDVRPAFDFLFALSTDTTGDDLPAADTAWLKDSLAALPKDVRSYLNIEYQRDVLVHAGSWLVDKPQIKTAAQVAAAVKEAVPAELFRTLLMY
ncbi:MAG TPA: hypothetical protein VF484_03980, partial [Candidatus Limnocylindrales bacterium]